MDVHEQIITNISKITSLIKQVETLYSEYFLNFNGSAGFSPSPITNAARLQTVHLMSEAKSEFSRQQKEEIYSYITTSIQQIHVLFNETMGLVKNSKEIVSNIRNVMLIKLQNIFVQFRQMQTRCKEKEIENIKRDLKIKFPNLSENEIENIIQDAISN